MTGYELIVGLNNEEIFISARFFGLGPDNAGDLNNYARTLDGKAKRKDLDFSDGFKTVSFLFHENQEGRHQLVLYNMPEAEPVKPWFLASAHAHSYEASEKMLNEFAKLTGFQETDVDEKLKDLYKAAEQAGTLTELEAMQHEA